MKLCCILVVSTPFAHIVTRNFGTTSRICLKICIKLMCFLASLIYFNFSSGSVISLTGLNLQGPRQPRHVGRWVCNNSLVVLFIPPYSCFFYLSVKIIVLGREVSCIGVKYFCFLFIDKINNIDYLLYLLCGRHCKKFTIHYLIFNRVNAMKQLHFAN